MSSVGKRHREESAPIVNSTPSESSVDLDDALADIKNCKMIIHTFATLAAEYVIKSQKKHGAYFYCTDVEEGNQKIEDFLETLKCRTRPASTKEEEEAYLDGKAQYSIGEYGCGRCAACGSSLTGAQCDCEC